MFNALGHPCTKEVTTAVVTLCRWPFILQLTWPYCSVNSQQYATDMSAHNCTTHYSTVVAVLSLLSFIQSQHATPAVRNLSLSYTSLLQSDLTWVSKYPPATLLYQTSFPPSLSNICLQYAEQCEMVEPTLRVTAQNLYNSCTIYSDLRTRYVT